MSFLLSWLEPTFNALHPFNSLPFIYRWRLLLFQPILLLINTLKYTSCILFHRHTIIHIPTRTGHPIRTLVFHPSTPPTPNSPLLPLHLTLHAGGFLGGIPEYNAPFSALLSTRTGAVVVAPTYRFAPLHPYPAATNDITDVLSWLQRNARSTLHADPSLLTISGFSAGANLALSAAQSAPAVRASVTFYAPVDLRTPAQLKPKPAGMPPGQGRLMKLIFPLLDTYCGRDRGVREASVGDARLHPILARVVDLPERMLFVVPTVDILVHEQLMFVERLRREIDERGEEQRVVESLIVEGQMHGWVELPDFAIDMKTKDDAFDAAIEFIRETHGKHGFERAC
ncbi:putative lipase/esterase family protein [Macrophomina phaseolina]|uniref:Lipase/esterase family protein n=1 Tax=Macrophomina phaseolina TaxID=35725 RepID=A0ABQ8GL07_9PEZI|nr:putative lipase/esterase family protein [Macrophomina phaseolina]